MSAAIDPALTPDVIGELADRTGLPIQVKGVLHAADATTAVGAGAAGIVVSNHGRRQVDGVLPTALALPSIVDAVGDTALVTVDGGIRSGVDVLRALAMGAKAVGVGRPVFWGLAANGVRGVARRDRHHDGPAAPGDGVDRRKLRRSDRPQHDRHAARRRR